MAKVLKDYTKPVYAKPIDAKCINARPIVSKDALEAITNFKADEIGPPTQWRVDYSVAENKDGAITVTTMFERQSAADAFVALIANVGATLVAGPTEEEIG
jgi:hypothetical protein